jgi:hypothetical protein
MACSVDATPVPADTVDAGPTCAASWETCWPMPMAETPALSRVDGLI